MNKREIIEELRYYKFQELLELLKDTVDIRSSIYQMIQEDIYLLRYEEFVFLLEDIEDYIYLIEEQILLKYEEEE